MRKRRLVITLSDEDFKLLKVHAIRKEIKFSEFMRDVAKLVRAGREPFLMVKKMAMEVESSAR